jgi:hypothetical protein
MFNNNNNNNNTPILFKDFMTAGQLEENNLEYIHTYRQTDRQTDREINRKD